MNSMLISITRIKLQIRALGKGYFNVGLTRLQRGTSPVRDKCIAPTCSPLLWVGKFPAGVHM